MFIRVLAEQGTVPPNSHVISQSGIFMFSPMKKKICCLALHHVISYNLPV
jgi:hypothetical protein